MCLAVAASFGACSALFFGFVLLGHFSVEESCSRVSFTHHLVATILGLFAHWSYADYAEIDRTLAPNDQFPYAVLLLHFNLGYFLYDTVHAAVWDQRWLPHHLISVTALWASAYGNCAALTLGINTWILESGSLMYSLYLVFKSEKAYVAFVVCYTISRIYYAAWSYKVLTHVKAEIFDHTDFSPPVWAPFLAGSLQVAILTVNWTFVFTHHRKLLKRLGCML